MYIKKEVGHGRGEFEIAGEYGNLKARDLVDRDLYLNCGPAVGILPLDMVLERSQGKRRLRIKDKTSTKIHLHRQVLALLLMPPSTRDEATLAGGEPTLGSAHSRVSRPATGLVPRAARHAR